MDRNFLGKLRNKVLLVVTSVSEIRAGQSELRACSAASAGAGETVLCVGARRFGNPLRGEFGEPRAGATD